MGPTLEQITEYRDYLVEKETVTFLKAFLLKYHPDKNINFTEVVLSFVEENDGEGNIRWLETVELIYPDGENIAFDFSTEICQVANGCGDEDIFYENVGSILSGNVKIIIVANIVMPFWAQGYWGDDEVGE